MKLCEELVKQFIGTLREQFDLMIDEASDSCILALPFKDSMGDNFVIRIREHNGLFVLDDAGVTENTLFTIRETIGDRKAEQLVNELMVSFDAHLDRAEGVIETKSQQGEINDKLLHFTKLLLTLDTMLVQTVSVEKQAEKPHRQSLGPRASQKIRKSLHPLIKEGLINYRYTIDGLAIPDWLVDFVYKPSLQPLAQTSEFVILITVDLAVVEPILKSAHAYSRAVDIKTAHQNYELRIIFDTHGQNSASSNAARFITEHELYSKAYKAIDVSEAAKYGDFVATVNREVALNL